MGLGKVRLSSIEIGAQGLAYFLAKTRRSPTPGTLSRRIPTDLESLITMSRPKRGKGKGKAPPTLSAKLESAT
jgi:hypothetical protein